MDTEGILELPVEERRQELKGGEGAMEVPENAGGPVKA